jgi:hypothetical protein
MEGLPKSSPPFEKGRTGGIYERPFQKTKFIPSPLFFVFGRRAWIGRGTLKSRILLSYLQMEALARVTYSVIPAEAGIQNRLEILDSGSRFACPE